MTIRLLKPYAQRPANAIATFGASVEQGLIDAGKASADLTGGVRFYMPRAGLLPQLKQVVVGSVSIGMEEKTTVMLAEGQVLLVTGAAATVGAVSRAGSADAWVVGAGALPPIGPFSGMQLFNITCNEGGVEAKVQDAILSSTQLVVTDNPLANDGRPDGTIYFVGA